MTGDHPQFALPLTAAYSYLPQDFVVTDGNRLAYDTLAAQASEPVRVLYGPEASGKTHLSHVWAARHGAEFLSPGHLSDADVGRVMQKTSGAYVLDGLESLSDETVLFHFMNAVREQGGKLLLVSRAAPSHLGFALADLRSRINAAPAVALDAPDDGLLRAVLVKQFSDRQLRVGDDVLHYLQTRIDRSFASARDWVDKIDAAALASQRRVTVAWLRDMMEKQDRE